MVQSTKAAGKTIRRRDGAACSITYLAMYTMAITLTGSVMDVAACTTLVFRRFMMAIGLMIDAREKALFSMVRVTYVKVNLEQITWRASLLSKRTLASSKPSESSKCLLRRMTFSY